MQYKKLIIYTDGGARGNPGKSGIGAVLKNEDKKNILEISEYIGIATNNQAEYRAAIRALEEAQKLAAEDLKVYLDSELIVKQLNGKYRVKNIKLIPLYVELTRLQRTFKTASFEHVRREFNKEADALANLAMDNAN